MEHESALDTNKVTRNANNSKNYGLFQINSKDYCAEGRKGGLCNMKCEGKWESLFRLISLPYIPTLCSLDLSNDDISDDAACAKIIEQREGFKYWKGWSRYCRNTQNLPNLAVSCNLPAIGS